MSAQGSSPVPSPPSLGGRNGPCLRFRDCSPGIMTAAGLKSYKAHIQACLREGSERPQTYRSNRRRASSPVDSAATVNPLLPERGGEARRITRRRVYSGAYAGQPCLKATRSTFGPYPEQWKPRAPNMARSTSYRGRIQTPREPRPTNTEERAMTCRVMSMGSAALRATVPTALDASLRGITCDGPTEEEKKMPPLPTHRRHHPGTIEWENAFCNYCNNALHCGMVSYMLFCVRSLCALSAWI